MVWIFLIVQALILFMVGYRFRDKHDGVYTLTLNIISLLSFFLGVIMAPLLVKLSPFLLIAPSRIFPSLGHNFPWTQRSFLQIAVEGLHQFAPSLARPLEGFFSRFGMEFQSPAAARSNASFSASADQTLTWSTFKEIVLLLVGSLTAWFSYLSYEIAHLIPEALTKLGDRRAGKAT